MSELLNNIFRRYDVMGQYPGQLTEGLAYKIGRAFVQFINPKTIAVGRDCRVGSEEMSNGFIKGAREQGADITGIGLVTADIIYFAVGKHGFDAGCIINTVSPEHAAEFYREEAE